MLSITNIKLYVYTTKCVYKDGLATYNCTFNYLKWTKE